MAQTPGERLADLESRMKVVEAGVSNFRAFQKDANDFFADHKRGELERDKKDKTRSRIHFSLLGGLIAIVAGCFIALFTWLLEGHHTVSQISQTTQRQDAGLPNVR